MHLQEWLITAREKLASTSISNPMADVRFIVSHVLSIMPAQQHWIDKVLSNEEQTVLDGYIARRMQGEPLAYLLKHQPFYDIDLIVSPDTLIPRPETERLVEVAIEILHTATGAVVDAGTGSGAIAIALARQFLNRKFFALDRSVAALAIAQKNIQRYALKNIQLLQADWLLPFANETLGIIVSNPPYIAPDDTHLPALRYEPQSALIADNSGYQDLFFLLNQAGKTLQPGGYLILEHGYQQAWRVKQYAARQDIWQSIKGYQDYLGYDRVSVFHKRF